MGYSGGTLENPTYEDVCSHATGHAETVLVEFDPAVVSYDQLLEAFWNCHDPTQLNRQGPDVGTQYRSVIFYHTPEQQAAAEASKDRLAQQRQAPPADRHRDRPRRDVLPGRGVSPAISGEAGRGKLPPVACMKARHGKEAQMNRKGKYLALARRHLSVRFTDRFRCDARWHDEDIQRYSAGRW